MSTRNKRALIRGTTGQDGAYLARFLLEKGFQVFGTFRRVSTPNFWRMQVLDILDRVKLIPADLIDAASVAEAIELADPEEIYHLAAQSFALKRRKLYILPRYLRTLISQKIGNRLPYYATGKRFLQVLGMDEIERHCLGVSELWKKDLFS